MEEAAIPRASTVRTGWLVSAALFLFTLGLYARVAGHPFLFFDDNQYVTENPVVRAGLTWQGVIWAFTSLQAFNWHPLTWLSHMLDVELFGLSPGPHHLVNAALHAGNAVLVFLVFRRMTGATWRSALVAALFAVHPTHVESVAWVAERKDVLSTLFGLLALLVYAAYARRGGPLRYAGVLALFALSLLAKPMWVTLPFLLLLLDVWPLQRWSATPIPRDAGPPASPGHGLGRLVLEKLPLLALSAASSVVTVVAQERGGAVAGLQLELGSRLGNALVAYARYVGKTLWPSPLAVYYPFDVGGLPAWAVALAAAFLLGVTVLSVLGARRMPWLLVGWAWFLGTLVPVIGLVQVGGQAMANRYTYLPSIGLFVIVAWGGNALAARWRLGTAFRAVAVVGLVALASVTWNQIGYWSSHVTLFRHALAVEPPSALALGLLADGLRREGKVAEALPFAEQAVRLEPGAAHHWIHLGLTYRYLRRLPEARGAFQRAIAADPRSSLAWLNLGSLDLDQGRRADALKELEEAARLGSTSLVVWGNLGVLYDQAGRTSEAERAFERAVGIAPGSVAALTNLGLSRLRAGRYAQAEAALARAVAIDPANQEARRGLQEARAALRR